MNKVLIVYIATAEYNRMWDGFVNSLNNFVPGFDKSVIVFTDHAEYYNHQYDGIEILDVNKIDHNPWPIVAQLKFKYILEAMNMVNEDYCHCFYFNSNIEFRKEVNSEIFLRDKVIAVDNCGWDYVGRIPEKLTYDKPLDKKSPTYIPGWYRYVQSSVMGGPISLYKEFCMEAHSMIVYDLAHNRIPVFHDETAWNKVVYDHQDKVEYLTADFNSCAINHKRNGFPDPYIVMRDSSLTQNKYKDDFHTLPVKVPPYISRVPLNQFDSVLVNDDVKRIIGFEYFYESIFYHGVRNKKPYHDVLIDYQAFINNSVLTVDDLDHITVVYTEPTSEEQTFFEFELRVNNDYVEIYG